MLQHARGENTTTTEIDMKMTKREYSVVDPSASGFCFHSKMTHHIVLQIVKNISNLCKAN